MDIDRIVGKEPAPVKYSERAKVWHIMTTTRGGTVSLLKNLDAPTARQAYQRLNPDDHPRKFINMPKGGSFSYGSGFRHCSDGDIAQVSILGPEGADLDPWRGVEPFVIDCEKVRIW